MNSRYFSSDSPDQKIEEERSMAEPSYATERSNAGLEGEAASGKKKIEIKDFEDEEEDFDFTAAFPKQKSEEKREE